MSRSAQERILLIGDSDEQLQSALSAAVPGAQVTTAPNYFEAIAEMSGNSFTAVLAAAEPIERRPEAAVKTLRKLAGDGRLLLFGESTLEPLSRKMLDFGCDDYIITPTTPGELSQLFGTPSLRISEPGRSEASAESSVAPSPEQLPLLMGLPLAEILLDAMVQHPSEAAAAAVRQINERIAPRMQLFHVPHGGDAPPSPEGAILLHHPVRVNNEDVATVHLALPRDEEESVGRHFLAQLAQLLGKLATLEDRHLRLQKLAITDELTGLYNCRYFRHFLARILEKARVMRFPVTLLLFDIDDFKKYNDSYGHGVGDEILRQTAALMKRCCREHDLVARLGGDEFAVVFWEKEGPRQARDGKPTHPGKPPETPREILERFRLQLAHPDFSNLGSTGRGTLTISGGMAVYPYDAHDMQTLIDEADNRLVFGAKQGGKNTIYLVDQDSRGEK